MEITRITAPMFKLGEELINEYELRNLQLEVAKGLKPFGIELEDSKGQKFFIREDGMIDDEPFGMDICGMLTMDLLRFNHTLYVPSKPEKSSVTLNVG
jgi:hypothetical protein